MPKKTSFKLFPSRLTPLLSFGLVVLALLIGVTGFYLQWEYDDVEISAETIRTLKPAKAENQIINKESGFGTRFYQDLKHGFSFSYFNGYQIKPMDDQGGLALVDKDGDYHKILAVLGPYDSEGNEPASDTSVGYDKCEENKELYGKNAKICSETDSLAVIFNNLPYRYFWKFNGIDKVDEADQLILKTFEMSAVK